MELRQISDGLTVSPQILPQQVASLGAMGFRSIICNRPDAEDAGQPAFAEVAAAAQRAGMDARHIPVVGGQIDEGQIAAFADAMKALPGPILAYCRSGNRSATLWSLVDARNGAAPAA